MALALVGRPRRAQWSGPPFDASISRVLHSVRQVLVRWSWIGAGIVALGIYGFVATLQPDANFGRILAAYGGVFVAGSLLWGMALDGFRPDRWDITGALICLLGVAVIMYAPRPA
jgi:small multidrug resistance family-3 protein